MTVAMVDNSSWRSLCFVTPFFNVAQILNCSHDFIFANISVLLFKDPQVCLAALLPDAFAGCQIITNTESWTPFIVTVWFMYL